MKMLGKGTKLYSILRMKCPQCHEGAFFEGHPYRFSTIGEVKKRCPKCNLKYSKEPSFYAGSYYVVYALGVTLMVAVWALIVIVFPDSGPGTILSSMFIVLILLSPVMYALSKIIWANFFFKYKKAIIGKKDVN